MCGQNISKISFCHLPKHCSSVRRSSVSVQSSAAPKLSTQRDFLESGSCWEGLYCPSASHCRPCSLLWQEVTPGTSEKGEEKRCFDDAVTGLHRMAEAGQDLWRLQGQSPLLRQGHLELAAQGPLQMAFIHFQGLHNLPGQPGPVPGCPHS